MTGVEPRGLPDPRGRGPRGRARVLWADGGGAAFADRVAADVARLLVGGPPAAAEAGPPGVPLVVVGAHLGPPLNGLLTGVGARLLQVRTAKEYRMVALPTVPPKPGLLRVTADAGSVEGELWALPPAGLAALLAGLPWPVALGRVRLGDGNEQVGSLCEPAATEGAPDITEYGGWRAYLVAG